VRPYRVALGCALSLAACNDDRSARTLSLPSASSSQRAAPAGVAAITRDPGEICSDIGSIRACWGGECGRAGCLVARTVPEPAAFSALGWRCTGTGENRRCFDRVSRAGRFECRENTCIQRHPRLPDDGEWLCADSAGAVVCAGGEPAAGVAPARADAGWFCGTRSGTRPVASTGTRTQPTAAAPIAGPRVCVDLDPDFPDGSAKPWRCRYSYEHGVQRICERQGAEAKIGDACDAERPCVDGSHCSAGRCIVARPGPDCWLDTDCKSSACRFGSCTRSDP
jgi:hypothetical protein